jgi:hypothetical protein
MIELPHKTTATKGELRDMFLMRNLITDLKLFKILDMIEETLGYKIQAKIMPPEHRNLASCTMNIENNIFSLWFIDEALPLQQTLCHELIHIVLYFEGYPGFIITDPFWETWQYKTQIVTMLSNLVLHIEVWKITDMLGFREHDYYHLVDLLEAVENITLFDKPIDPRIILPGQAAYLAQGLLSPAKEEIKTKVRLAAMEKMPKALELADAICLVFDKYSPISPQSCVAALGDILDIIECPREILQPLFPPVVDMYYRNKLLDL